jgi:hypothetical protein
MTVSNKTIINSDDQNLNIFTYTNKLKSIKFLFVTIIMIFLFLLIIFIFWSNFLVMSYLYTTINDNYLSQYIILPMSNENENFTQTMNIRIKTMEEIIMESKMINMKIMTGFAFTQDVIFETQEFVDSNYYQGLTVINNNKLNDFYINVELDTEKQSLTKTKFYLSKFKSLAYFMQFFQKNYFFPFEIDEMVIIDPYFLNYILYAKDFNLNEDIIIDSFEQKIVWESTTEILDKYGFCDYIVENIYSKDDSKFNYIKIHHTHSEYLDLEFVFLIRLNHQQLGKVFNTMGNNMTIVFKHDHFFSEGYTYNFLPISNYLNSFFRYAFDDNISQEAEWGSKKLSNEPKYLMAQRDNYFLTNFENYFRLIDQQQNLMFFNNSYIKYNLNHREELLVMSGLFYKILKKYFDINIYKDMGITVNATECLKQKNLLISNMTCDILNFDENYLLQNLQFGKNLTNLSTSSFISETYNHTLINKFGDAVYLNYGGIFKSTYGRTFEKKFLIYMNKLNNLNIVAIDMLNVEQYYDIEENFINKMYVYSGVIYSLLIVFSSVVFFISLYITLSNVDSLLGRINAIRNIKSHLFYKDETLHMAVLEDISEIRNKKFSKVQEMEEFSKKCFSDDLTETEKFEILDKDLFDRQLFIILFESKRKLISLLSNVDNETDPAFLNRLQAFDRRYRLRKIKWF